MICETSQHFLSRQRTKGWGEVLAQAPSAACRGSPVAQSGRWVREVTLVATACDGRDRGGEVDRCDRQLPTYPPNKKLTFLATMTEVMDPQNEAAQFVALSKAIDLRFFIQMGLKAEAKPNF